MSANFTKISHDVRLDSIVAQSLQSSTDLIVSKALPALVAADAAITANASSGVLQATIDAAAGAQNTNAITCSAVGADSVVLASISDWTGTIVTNGIPYVTVDSIVDGSFNLVIHNLHSANALSGNLSVSFLVIG